jgi:hypothetical protein
LAGDLHHRSFGSITDAVRFVLDDLADHHRVSAWIKIENSSLTLEQSEQFYKEHRLAFAVAAGRERGRDAPGEGADKG